jgi:predicted transposase YbfD/YdcC
MEMRGIRFVLKKLKEVQDPRQLWKIRHSLVDILAISIIAVMCGAQSSHQIHLFAQVREAWFRRFLALPNGIPNRLTINRVLSLIDTRQFCVVFTQIMQHIQHISEDAIVSLDGKSCYAKAGQGVVYMVSAWCNQNSSILGQMRTQDKSNEITAIPELLKLLDIKGLTVTIDAIGCQREIVQQIVTGNKADYVIGLKKNQPIMYEEFSLYAQDTLQTGREGTDYQHTQSIEKGHGRIERRDYYLFPDVHWYKDHKAWKNLQSVIMVKSRREVLGKPPSEETRYYISSLKDVEKAACAVRSHWGIENKLHWSLDTLMREDDWRNKLDTVATNLATIRKLALHFLRKADLPEESKLSGPMLMFRCALDLPTLERVLFGKRLRSC